MHGKGESEGTSQSMDTSWATSPRTHRTGYYTQSPPNQDVEKLSLGSSPFDSPAHHHCHSTTSRFSSALKNKTNFPPRWRHVPLDDEEGPGGYSGYLRPYLCAGLVFVVVSLIFCFILWGVGKNFKPHVDVKEMVLVYFDVQAGEDHTGVPTDLLSLNSTVKIMYRNIATFFSVHVSSTPLQLNYFQLKLASGQVHTAITLTPTKDFLCLECCGGLHDGRIFSIKEKRKNNGNTGASVSSPFVRRCANSV